MQVNPNLEDLETKYFMSSSGDILVISAGTLDLESNIGFMLFKPIEIRGATYGIDAKSRSTVGNGDISFIGTPDPEETNLIGSATTNVVLKIYSSNVKLDGLTFTSGYTGNSEHSAIWISGDSVIENVAINNCIIRQLATN